MPQESATISLQKFLLEHAQIIEWAHTQAHCSKWQISTETFAEVLCRSCEGRFKKQSPGHSEVQAYIRSLHLEDLALACGCSQAIPAAWDFFVAQYRADLRAAAGAILRRSGGTAGTSAEELADSIYAELYGINSGSGSERKSLFRYFHGRSKLSTWLRAILAQRHIDLLRAGKHTISLDKDAESDWTPSLRHTEVAPDDPHRAEYILRLDAALHGALAGLASQDQLLLAYYYVDQRSLAEIGRILRAHESTVSRQLDRVRSELRDRVVETLRREIPARDNHAEKPGMSEAQIGLIFEYALADWPFDLERALSNRSASGQQPEE